MHCWEYLVSEMLATGRRLQDKPLQQEARVQWIHHRTADGISVKTYFLKRKHLTSSEKGNRRMRNNSGDTMFTTRERSALCKCSWRAAVHRKPHQSIRTVQRERSSRRQQYPADTSPLPTLLCFLVEECIGICREGVNLKLGKEEGIFSLNVFVTSYHNHSLYICVN